jgi:hypothetical protein
MCPRMFEPGLLTAALRPDHEEIAVPQM